MIKLYFCYANISYGNNLSSIDASFPAAQPTKGWETQHQCFGHIRYSRLHKLFNHQLVTSFLIDCDSLIPGCIACTEAKQSVIPFNKKGEQETEPGEVTHIDVQGKYNVASINGFYYYLLMVDNILQYIIVEFIKLKDQVVQKVRNYFTHLQTYIN